jgi:hypothetical protein
MRQNATFPAVKRSILMLGLVVSLAAACSGDDGGAGTSTPITGEGTTFPPGSISVRASSDLAVGSERLLVGVAAPDGTRLGSPEDVVTFEIAPVDEPERTSTFPATFTWIVPDAVGIYRATVEFDVAGPWQVTVVPESGPALAPTAFDVYTQPMTPAIGEPAPAVATPTTADRPIEQLTTDPSPDPTLYDLSLDEAVSSGATSVVIFATPKFCQTTACGPMLDDVKEVATSHPDVEFLHLEVYDGFWESGFAPDATHLSEAVRAWNLPSEPWIFVVGPDGNVRARFEGVVDTAELEAALA